MFLHEYPPLIISIEIMYLSPSLMTRVFFGVQKVTSHFYDLVHFPFLGMFWIGFSNRFSANRGHDVF